MANKSFTQNFAVDHTTVLDRNQMWFFYFHYENILTVFTEQIYAPNVEILYMYNYGHKWNIVAAMISTTENSAIKLFVIEEET